MLSLWLNGYCNNQQFCKNSQNTLVKGEKCPLLYLKTSPSRAKHLPFSPVHCSHAHAPNSNRQVLTAASLVNIEFSQAGSV